MFLFFIFEVFKICINAVILSLKTISQWQVLWYCTPNKFLRIIPLPPSLFEWVSWWMEWWINGWMGWWVDCWMNGWMDWWGDCFDGWMGGWVDCWMNGWIDGGSGLFWWMDGWVDCFMDGLVGEWIVLRMDWWVSGLFYGQTDGWVEWNRMGVDGWIELVGMDI